MDSWKTAILRWSGTNDPSKGEERRTSALRSGRSRQRCSKAPFPSVSSMTTNTLPPQQSKQGSVGSSELLTKSQVVEGACEGSWKQGQKIFSGVSLV